MFHPKPIAELVSFLTHWGVDAVLVLNEKGDGVEVIAKQGRRLLMGTYLRDNVPKGLRVTNVRETNAKLRGVIVCSRDMARAFPEVET